MLVGEVLDPGVDLDLLAEVVAAGGVEARPGGDRPAAELRLGSVVAGQQHGREGAGRIEGQGQIGGQGGDPQERGAVLVLGLEGGEGEPGLQPVPDRQPSGNLDSALLGPGDVRVAEADKIAIPVQQGVEADLVPGALAEHRPVELAPPVRQLHPGAEFHRPGEFGPEIGIGEDALDRKAQDLERGGGVEALGPAGPQGHPARVPGGGRAPGGLAPGPAVVVPAQAPGQGEPVEGLGLDEREQSVDPGAVAGPGVALIVEPGRLMLGTEGDPHLPVRLQRPW